MSQGWWGREGLQCGYKGAAGAAWSLHSLESGSELGAIARPESTARRREDRSLLRSSQIAAKAEDEESRLLFWTCSPAPGGVSILQQLLQCGASNSVLELKKKIKKFPRSLFLSDPELWLLALHQLLNQSDREF